MGGEHEAWRKTVTRRGGSSPRGRGIPVRGRAPALDLRVIPAWAGNTVCGTSRGTSTPGHPRVGGEHPPRPDLHQLSSGSSPRGRGTLAVDYLVLREGRVIPAWAGNTLPRSRSRRKCAGHPRVGGEHQVAALNNNYGTGSSPRGRGTRAGRPAQQRDARVIPAWAGNTSFRAPHCCLYSGHPRVGGEHS